MADPELPMEMQEIVSDERTDNDNDDNKDDNNGDTNADDIFDDDTAIPSSQSLTFRRTVEQEGSIQVFTPDKFREDMDDASLEKLVRDSLVSKVAARSYRLIAFALHAVISVIIITYLKPEFHITKCLALGLAGMFVTYFIHIYYLIGHSTQMHRIYSLSGVVPKWTSMPITYRQLIYKYQPIQSISEFSAIGGGIANQMLVVISVSAWMVVLCQTLNNIWFEKIWISYANILGCTPCEGKRVNLFDLPNGIDALLVFIGAFGLVLIGIFELDPFSKSLERGHMTGVFLGFGCPIGYSIQQIFAVMEEEDEHKLLSHKFGLSFAIVADIVAVTFALIWTLYYNKKSDQLAEELKQNLPTTRDEMENAHKRVRALTIRNVVSESFTLLAGSLTLCLWLWNYNELNPSFSNTEGVLPNEGPWNQYYSFIKEKYKCSNKLIKFEFDPNTPYCPQI